MSEIINVVSSLETSATTAALDEALAKAQGDIELAAKDKVNSAFKSSYADITSLWNAARAAISKNGISVTQWPLASTDNRLHIITRIACKGEWMRARFSMPVDKNNAHGVASAVTYAKKFTLGAALGIVADEPDDDGVEASKKPGDQPHKPGAPGSAGGGTDFRPAGPRRMPTSNWVDDAMNDGIVDQERTKGTLPLKPANGNGKPPAPDERAQKIAARAKDWVTQAIATLRLTGQTPDTLSQFLVDHVEQIRFLEDHAPDAHERFFAAFNSASEAAQARVS